MSYEPERPTTVEVRRAPERASLTGWVVASIVAVVAIIAVAFMVSNRPATPTEERVAQALDQGRAQGALDAQASMNAQASVNAQTAQAQIAAQQAARDTAQAAAEARDSANLAAANAADSARDANARVAADANGQPPPVPPPQ